MKKQSGFTLIELMIVVAIIAIIASIAIPNLLSARLNANETASIATLRNISSSQAQFQASSKADVDNDGCGEFGMFRELSGASGVRTTPTFSAVGSILNPPVLSGAFRTMDVNGDVSRSGYIFHMLLPGAAGAGVYETQPGGTTGAIDSDLAETTWCCYSNPASYASSGNRTFFVNQTGDITGTDASTYTGHGLWGSTQCGYAFKTGGAATITGAVAVGTRGRDGHLWKQIN